MNFPGWNLDPDKLIYRREHEGLRAVVGRFDGWNWGFMILNPSGLMLHGRLNSSMDTADAISRAEACMKA